ncbi:MAG TPA: prolipoprotein diacylglyceryl transferase family protein [Candidatus Dormibacteraeota bacterium]|nr:prolipoprotein diacylglyceryl transferase family protein [Candidatus Dormibacteraeota bacterium]
MGYLCLTLARISAPDAGSPSKRGGLDAFLETAAQEQLVLSYWFESAPRSDPYQLVVRFTGRRTGVTGRPQAGDQFVRDETIDVSAPGGGPVSVTVRIGGVDPGEWIVTEKLLSPTRAERRRRGGGRASADPAPPELHRAAWSLHRRRLSDAPTAPVRTALAPFALVPGLVPGVYFAMAVTGILLGLVVQTLLVAHEGLPVGRTVLVSTLAITVGVIGAKVWFVVLHRRERLMNGWCIQGLLTGVVVVLVGGSFLARVPLGTLLDLTTPGLFMGMAVGRVGCFFAGCCAGRPTAAWWGVWSSDQRLGVRRLPTQLLELGLALAVGLVALAIVLVHGPANGTLLVGATAVYTLCRQGILLLRAERRKSLVGPPLTAAAAAVLLVADLALVALTGLGRTL